MRATMQNEPRRPACWARTVASAVGLAASGVLGAQIIRVGDRRHAEEVWTRLSELSSTEPARFTPAMVEDLPEPARRYLRYAIAPGAALCTVAEIDMVGRIGLGDRDAPRYMLMRAREIIAPPYGFVWIPSIGSGLMRISGSDGYVGGEAWTRFWLLGFLPVARPAVTPDLIRSAAARSIIEGALWVPASLLPQNGAAWEPIDTRRARAVVDHRGERFAVDLTIADNGQPVSAVMQRWSNANPEGLYQWQPFGCAIEAVGMFDGYTVPVRLQAGNHFGTESYFPFFRAEVVNVRYR